MDQNKKSLIIGGVALLIFIIIVGYRVLHKSVDTVASPDLPVLASNLTPAKISATKKETIKAPYDEIVASYINSGRRLQFDEKCQALPILNTFKAGTVIMVDNRSDKNRTIRIGTASYKISAYSYELVKLSAPKLPTTYLIDCDSQQNPATIIVQ